MSGTLTSTDVTSALLARMRALPALSQLRLRRRGSAIQVIPKTRKKKGPNMTKQKNIDITKHFQLSELFNAIVAEAQAVFKQKQIATGAIPSLEEMRAFYEKKGFRNFKVVNENGRIGIRPADKAKPKTPPTVKKKGKGK